MNPFGKKIFLVQDTEQATLKLYLLDTPCEESVYPTLIVGDGEDCGGLGKKVFARTSTYTCMKMFLRTFVSFT